MPRKKPPKKTIRQWVKDETTSWFLERLAFHLNSIDTVRNITLENLDEALARKMAIEVIENALADIYQEGELAELQKKLAEDEDSIIKRLKEVKSEF